MARFKDSSSPGTRPVDLLDGRLYVERFELLDGHLSPGLLGLSLRLPFELPADAHPTLLLGREVLEHAVTPRVASSCRPPRGVAPTSAWLWRGVFAAPPQPASDPCTWFALQVYEEQVLALPAPRELAHAVGADAKGWRAVRSWPYGLRRAALVLVVTCQFSVMPAFSSGGALADGAVAAPTSEGASEEPPSTPAPGGAGEVAPEGGGSIEPPAESGGGSEPPPESAPAEPPSQSPPGDGEAGGEPPAQTPPSTPNEVTQQPPSQPGSHSEGAPHAPSAEPVNTPAPTPNAGVSPSAVAGASGPVHVSTGRRAIRVALPNVTAGHAHPGHSTRRDHRQSGKHSPARRRSDDVEGGAPEASPTDAPLEVSLLLSWLPSGLTALEANEPPPYLIPIYEAAGHRYGVPWRVLAAINEIETNYGNNLSVSSAGAVGWMQFMPGTWRQWAVDADHDGQLNPYSPQDAIFTAARYLQASGASRDLPGAIFAYNHADWYVAEVLLRAKVLGDTATFARVEKGYSLPLDARYMQQLGRTDDGVDIETAPDGALVYSITPGIVSAVASDPAGFGPNYPVIEATSGALVGQHIYYGHVAESLVQPGQRVAAGQPIAIMGHTGDALSLGHGHIEIGFSDAGGDPLSHHAAQAWTLAGDVMRSFLVTVSGQFGIHNS